MRGVADIRQAILYMVEDWPVEGLEVAARHDEEGFDVWAFPRPVTMRSRAAHCYVRAPNAVARTRHIVADIDRDLVVLRDALTPLPRFRIGRHPKRLQRGAYAPRT